MEFFISEWQTYTIPADSSMRQIMQPNATLFVFLAGKMLTA
jgi:hypothetical protein